MKPEFESILNKVKQYMILDEKSEYIIDIYLATAISLELERPIWMMVVAPPSSGKTELISLINQLDHYHPLHNISAKTLFSSHPSAGGGYMIRQVGEMGLLVFPDFTTILSQNSKSRAEVFNQLRIVFDGEAGQGSGLDTGEIRRWRGRVAVLATVTEAIEKIKESQNDLGERFLYYHFLPNTVNYESVEQLCKSDVIKEEVGIDSKMLIEKSRVEIQSFILPEAIKSKLYTIAIFVSQGRATVERDGYHRQVSNIHRPESPFRVFGLLQSIYVSLFAINGDEKRSMKIIKLIALSSIPKYRHTVLALTYFNNKSHPLDIFVSSLNISESKVRRVLEDLVKQRMIIMEADKEGKQFFKMNEKFREIAECVFQ